VLRLAVTVEGTVQGVGFRPFVARLAAEAGLSGWVKNGGAAVRIEVEGPRVAVDGFVEALRSAPPAARIERIESREVQPAHDRGFAILESAGGDGAGPALSPDRAVCAECIADMDDQRSRRFSYPFTHCARCGPRYAITFALPYDRPNTSMRGFRMCDACAREYADPRDRRLHAQPIACPACGPQLALLTPVGTETARAERAVEAAVAALLEGRILAMKGLGGFQLLVDATNDAAVGALRARKQRDEKPFAVMFPSLEAARVAALLSPAEEAALVADEAPILIVSRRDEADLRIAPSVAPGIQRLGIMLPYTPLHRVVLAAAGRPLVCTSGNLSEEPMCTDDAEALERLGAVADAFLVHDRPVVRPVDDSVARVGPSGLELLRRARGYTPLPLRTRSGPTVLAAGAQQKATVAVASRGRVVVSQHLGDLSSVGGALLHERTAAELLALFRAEPEVVACDLHPDFTSTRHAERWAARTGAALERVQHHHAHVAACMAEHGLDGPVLGFVWDGAGLGTDGTIWGGEALVVEGPSFRRAAHVRTFPLAGGERAMREPLRAALGLLFEVLGPEGANLVPMEPARRAALVSMLRAGVGAPRTSSIGRLFDAVAALSGVRTQPGYEGQAAQLLELAAEPQREAAGYPIAVLDTDPATLDPEPLVHAILEDVRRGRGASVISARFHAALVDAAVAVATRVGLERVVLSGGCFQNLRLSVSMRRRLEACGHAVFTPRLFPANDGGISLGQALVAMLRREGPDVSRRSG
jgi:hydrogenase maturation protein HypF